MESTELSARPLTRGDAAAIIGVLAVLQGEIAGSNVPEAVVDHLRRRLTDDGALAGGPGDQDLPAALEALHQRVRSALGE